MLMSICSLVAMESIPGQADGLSGSLILLETHGPIDHGCCPPAQVLADTEAGRAVTCRPPGVDGLLGHAQVGSDIVDVPQLLGLDQPGCPACAVSTTPRPKDSRFHSRHVRVRCHHQAPP